MSPKGIALLSSPHPRGHIVYPYLDEEGFARAITLYAGAGLRNGESVILITTRSHAGLIDRRLSDCEGFDTKLLQQTGQLTYAIAERTLTTFMVNGLPDEGLFKETLGKIIERAQSAAPESERPGLTRVFGEMVGLLWPANVEAAQRVESYWDDLIQQYSFSLLCSYPPKEVLLPHPLLGCHTHNLALEEPAKKKPGAVRTTRTSTQF